MASGLSALSDWIIYALGVVGIGGGGGVVGYVRRVDAKADRAETKAERNHRALFGADDDPNVEGVAKIVHETRSNLEEFRAETRREHRKVMERLEELDDG